MRDLETVVHGCDVERVLPQIVLLFYVQVLASRQHLHHGQAVNKERVVRT